ncbi:MAG: hypothetical protein F6J93_14045 [Oscillatoria sp. SIO1A7]|nr:hypothetical protein [Oscillatoria sp. SIO1A7]
MGIGHWALEEMGKAAKGERLEVRILPHFPNSPHSQHFPHTPMPNAQCPIPNSHSQSTKIKLPSQIP